ncbi:MAG: COX15/CtaA family protein [Pseudomonadota bacterium]
MLFYRSHFLNSNDLPVFCWLILCSFLVIFIISVGGVTRLTNSGLSMTNWNPVTGIMPPISEDSWNKHFELYRQSPEYQQINKGMSVSEFKKIFWFEYIHRIIGRVIGISFFVPFIFFLLKKRLQKPYIWKLSGIFFLVCLQGLIGWYMVRSGLSENARVSQYRLALHLGTAVIIYYCLLKVALQIKYGSFNYFADQKPKVKSQFDKLGMVINITFLLTFLQIISGAFVAGLDAGLVYNSFPLMGDGIIPAEINYMSPWYVNIFDNPVTVQFLHRVMAFILLFFTIYSWYLTFTNKSLASKKFGITIKKSDRAADVLN